MVRVWWEWVESDANWSDGASRDLKECSWAKRNGFKLEEVAQPWASGLELHVVLPQLQRIVGIGDEAAGAVDRLITALG